MGRIYNFGEFVNETSDGILYVFEESFLISDLLDSGIYDIDDIHKWMSDFDFDKDAHAVFVSDKRTSKTGFKISGSGVMSNSIYFRPTGKYSGKLIPESDRKLDVDDVTLFVFDKKRNEELRKGARQIHGFDYEDEIKILNDLDEVGGKTDKWDGFGNLSQKFLDTRLNDSLSINYNVGKGYVSLVGKDDISGIDTLLEVPSDFMVERYWNIKTSSTNEINMADFKSIAGLIYDDGKLVRKETVDEFILAVSRRIPGGETSEEYIVIIDAKKWNTYLPDFSNPNVLAEVNSLYKELVQHRVTEYSDVNDLAWREFISKYTSLTKDSLIKIRFKRKSPVLIPKRKRAQLRIQCAISWNDFDRILKENKHIKISKD